MISCLLCFTEFKPMPNKKFCGSRCRETWRNQVRSARKRSTLEALVECPTCGVSFDRFHGATTRWRVFCTDGCREVYYDGGFNNYELTPFQYNALLDQQGGVCAICDEPERKLRKGEVVYRLSIDHDHDTGAVRGLLCSECNRGLGAFDDDSSKVERALEYLTRKSD